MKVEEIDLLQCLPEGFFNLASQDPDHVLFRQASLDLDSTGKRIWNATTYGESAKRISRLAHFLRSLGCGRGTHVAILSSTRPEWCETDFAILATGATTVSIYQSLPAHEVGYILHDSNASIVFVENAEQLKKIRELEAAPCPIPAREDIPESSVQLSFRKLIMFESPEAPGDVLSFSTITQDSSLPETPPDSISGIRRDDVASLVYTSGTTGPPKGVVQTHGNHLANIYQSMMTGMFAPDGDLFLYLPLAHSFARLIAYLGFLTPVELKFTAVVDHHTSKIDLVSVARDLREGSAWVVPSVPRLFEKMMGTIRELAGKPGISAAILRLTLAASDRHYAATHEGKPAGALWEMLYSATDFVRSKLRLRLFGAHFRHGIAGGAKLPVEVNRFFAMLSMPIYEGYGLTETCVATNVNLSGKNRLGSVGPLFTRVEAKIAEDGEILFRGPNIARGYYNRPKATAEAWDSEGWFHTGDIGHLDSDGFLFITDRKKDLIVTAGGKKIPPQPIEGTLRNSAYISQAVLCGDEKPYCVVLITLNRPQVVTWLEKNRYPVPADLTTDTKVIALIQSEIEAVNKTLASYESIKKFHILLEDFSIENGFLTPTLKVKRKAVIAAFKPQIEALYSHAHP